MDDPAEKRYRGHAKWFRLISNNICYGPHPDAQDEVEQHLRIRADGRVWLTRYAYGDGRGHVCTSKEQIRIAPDAAEQIMKAVDHCFTGYSPQMATDVGRWYLLLMNEEGEEFKLHGSLICNSQCSQTKLSVLIRSVLDMTDLFAFDGYTVKDYVQRLCIDYHRITKIKPKTTDNEATNCFTWDYSEQLVINRASSTLEHVQHIGSNCQVSRKLYVQGGVENLLDGIKEGFFEDIKGEPVDAITDPNDQNHYRLTVDFHKAPQKVIIGSYGKDGLPVNWPSLMVEIYFFIRFYGMGEILNPSVYLKAKRRIG